MPPLHRLFGNPFLTLVGRALYRSPSRDFYCGLRGFRRDAVLALDLDAAGMEFALEMIVKATIRHLRITEVPTRSVARRSGAAASPAQLARRLAQPAAFSAAQPARRVSLSGRRDFSFRAVGHTDPVYRRYCRGRHRLCRAHDGHDRRCDQHRLRIDDVLGLCQGDRDPARAAVCPTRCSRDCGGRCRSNAASRSGRLCCCSD